MAISQAQIEKIISLAKDYGATHLILFGSAAEMPDRATDIDLQIYRVHKDERKGFAMTFKLARSLSASSMYFHHTHYKNIFQDKGGL